MQALYHDTQLSTPQDYVRFISDIAHAVAHSRLPCGAMPMHNAPLVMCLTDQDYIHVQYLIRLARDVMNVHRATDPMIVGMIYHALRMADATHEQAHDITTYTLQVFWSSFYNRRMKENKLHSTLLD